MSKVEALMVICEKVETGEGLGRQTLINSFDLVLERVEALPSKVPLLQLYIRLLRDPGTPAPTEAIQLELHRPVPPGIKVNGVSMLSAALPIDRASWRSNLTINLPGLEILTHGLHTFVLKVGKQTVATASFIVAEQAPQN